MARVLGPVTGRVVRMLDVYALRPSPALGECGLPDCVQAARLGAMIAVAAMVELVVVEGNALALAG
jgi:hypothetical protein